MYVIGKPFRRILILADVFIIVRHVKPSLIFENNCLKWFSKFDPDVMFDK